MMITNGNAIALSTTLSTHGTMRGIMARSLRLAVITTIGMRVDITTVKLIR